MKIANIGTKYARFAVRAVFEVFSKANAQVRYATASIKTPSHNKPINSPTLGKIHCSKKYPATNAQAAVVAQIIIIASF